MISTAAFVIPISPEITTPVRSRLVALVVLVLVRCAALIFILAGWRLVWLLQPLLRCCFCGRQGIARTLGSLIVGYGLGPQWTAGVVVLQIENASEINM